MDSSSSPPDIKTTATSNYGPTEAGRKMGFVENVMRGVRSLSHTLKRHENYVIHLVLVGAFVSLSMRSLDRQHQIDALEAERVSLEQENKGLKKRIWNLKQGMLEEAAKQDDRNLIVRLKALFGDSIVQESKPDSTGPKPKFVV